MQELSKGKETGKGVTMNHFDMTDPKSQGSLQAEVLSRPLEVLSPERPEIVHGSATIKHVMDLMREKDAPAVLVCVSEDGPIQGIFTERDALRVIKRGWDLNQHTIEEVMTPNPLCQGPWDSIGFALKKMITEGYQQIPIIDLDGRLSGIISRKQLLRYLGERLTESSNKKRRTGEEDWRGPSAIGA